MTGHVEENRFKNHVAVIMGEAEGHVSARGSVGMYALTQQELHDDHVNMS